MIKETFPCSFFIDAQRIKLEYLHHFPIFFYNLYFVVPLFAPFRMVDSEDVPPALLCPDGISILLVSVLSSSLLFFPLSGGLKPPCALLTGCV